MPLTDRQINITIGKVGQAFAQTLSDGLAIGDSQNKDIARLLGENLGIASSTTVALDVSAFVQKDATNTGYLPLTTTGSLTTLAAGDTTANSQLIFRRDITGVLAVVHSNVIIRQCRITGAVRIGRSSSNTDVAVSNTLIEDCEFIGSGSGDSGISDISGTDSLMQRNNIHGYENSVTIWGGGIQNATRPQLLNNFIHGDSGDSSAHIDGIELYGCVGGATVSGNTVLLTQNTQSVAPLNITPVPSTLGTILVENNLFQSQHDDYVILCDDSQGTSPINAIFNGNQLWRNTQTSNFFALRNVNGGSTYTGTGNKDFIDGSPVAVA